MGIDWIDDILQKAEGLPVLGGIAHDLRFAYEIWRIDPPDPKPVHNQANTLDNLQSRANTLLSSFNDSLLTLRQNWTGDVADYYFGPQVTAFQIEHDMEPSSTGAGYLLWNRFNQVTALLDYNRAAHQSAHDTLVQIQNLHGDLQSQVYEAAGLLVADVATSATPGLEEFDLLDVPLTIERTDEAVQTAQEVEKVGEAVKDAEEIEKTIQTGITIAQIAKIVGAIGAIVGVALLAFLTHSNGSSPTNSAAPPKTISTLTDDEIRHLAQEFGVSEQTIRDLIKEHPNWTLEQLLLALFTGNPTYAKKMGELRAYGLTLQDVEYLLGQGFTPQQIYELLQSWKQLNKGIYIGKGGKQYNAGTLRELLDELENPNTDPTNKLGAWRLLSAIMQVGPSNVSAIEVYVNGVNNKAGDIDIVLKNGDLIEVGGDSKTPSDLQRKHNYYEQFLSLTGGQNTYFYGDPTGDDWKSVQQNARNAGWIVQPLQFPTPLDVAFP